MFRFSEKEKLEIQTIFEQCKKPDRFPYSRIVFFLRECERAIENWLNVWVSKEIQGSGGTQELQDIAKSFTDAMRSLEFASAGVQSCFWNMWRLRQGKDRATVMLLLAEIRSHALDMSCDVSSAGGIRKLCEYELILEVAEQYKIAFSKRPSARKNDQPFVLVMKKIANFVGMPDKSDMIVGKKIMSSAIQEKTLYWDSKSRLESK